MTLLSLNSRHLQFDVNAEAFHPWSFTNGIAHAQSFNGGMSGLFVSILFTEKLPIFFEYFNCDFRLW